MPQASSITISDGNNNVVFTPTTTNGKALFEARSFSVTSAGFPTLTANLDRANPRRATNKVTQNLSMPLEETVDGVVSVRSTPRFFGEFVLPDDMSAAERTAFHTLVKNALDAALMKGYVTTLEPVY